jgi:putative transposase
VRPGGVRAVVAESLLLKHQLVISRRARRRAPNLNSFDRFLLGLGSLFVPPNRLPKLAVILKARTLFRFHEALKKRKYRWLFSSGGHRRPGPKGPSQALIDVIEPPPTHAVLDQYAWRHHCRGLFQMPIAA